MVATRRSHSLDGGTPAKRERARSNTPKHETRERKISASSTRHSARLSGEPPAVISPTPKKIITEIPQYGHAEKNARRMGHDNSSPVSLAKRPRRLSEERIIAIPRKINELRPLRRSSRRVVSDYSSMNNHLEDDDEQESEGHGSMDKEKKRKNNRSELRDLLAGQGKDLSDMHAYMEPDIYSSVKSRKRASTRTRLYEEFYTGIARKQQDEEVEEQSDLDEEEDDDEDNTNEEQEEEATENDSDEENDEDDDGHPYQLRKVREAPQRYTIVRDVRQRRQRSLFEALPCSPVRRRRKKVQSANYNPYEKRRRRATQGNSTSTDSSSDDEIKFRKRQERSVVRARNECMPINMNVADLGAHSFARDRKKIGQSLADIDPMKLDSSVKFSSVGGHHKHIRALKEMVVFPLLYPEVFEKFNITPPRGCLFYGPPGTGKTLMARALSNECSTDGRRVSFFMKKGADCLSKWIGESERQLRLLFDQAYQMRPSIIFFDEIDGLAPVRSTRQDQIHSSIVSTLLALMDGLDGRGQIVVIGATNRIDTIDPALRRPGRFDREFLFPLPDKKAREEILHIHTGAWNPQLKPTFIDYLASKTVGYCGADLKALCTEAALFALRRRYPQIYKSSEKLQLDISTIKISSADFQGAIKNIIPTAQRSASNPGRALSTTVRPLMFGILKKAILQLTQLFPILNGKSKLLQEIKSQNTNQNTVASTADNSIDFDNDNENGIAMDGIYVGEPDVTSRINFLLPANNGIVHSEYTTLVQRISSTEHSLSTVHRPRFLICGDLASGHTSHLMPAVIYDMEGIPVHTIDLPAMYGVSVRTPEESCAQVFREARRVTPSIVYMPNALQWWNVATPTVQATLVSLLQDVPPHLPVLFLATANCSYRSLPRDLARFFHSDFCEVFEMSGLPTEEERREYFAPVFFVHALTPPPRRRYGASSLEILEKAPTPVPAPLTSEEISKLEQDEESTLRNLRLFLRDVLVRLTRDRRFKIFSKPVDFEEVPDYFEVIRSPMDFSTILTKIDQHKFQTVAQFLEDVDLICSNALEYNPDRCPEDKLIRHRACAMRDMAHAIVDQDLDPDFEKLCVDIVESRKRRGSEINKYAPKFYPVLPKQMKPPDIVVSTPNTSLAIDATSSVGEAIQSEKGAEKTPWKSDRSLRRSATKNKRKKSNWSKGMVPRKRKRIIIDEDEEEEKADEENESSEHEEEEEDDGEQEEAEDKETNEEENEFEKSGNEEEKNELSIEENKQMDIEEENEEMNIDSNGIEPKTEIIENGIELEETPEKQDQERKSSEKQEESELKENGIVNGCIEEDVDEASPEIPSDTEHPDTTEDKQESSSLPQEEELPVATIHPDSNVQNMNGKDSQDPGKGKKLEEQSIPIQIDDEEIEPQRMTLRSRDKTTSETTSNTKPKLMDVEEPPPPPLVIDHEKLKQLLEDVVTATDGFVVEDLERVHSSLSKCVQRHRMMYDRTELVKELDQEIIAIAARPESNN